MTSRVGLTVPEQTRPGKHAFSLRPKQVQAWLDELPRASLGETARLIYQLLNETNALRYPFAERARFLEQLREPVQYVTDSMRKHFLGITFPMPEKNQKVAAATREIYAAMATAYKIAVEDLAATHALFQDKKLLATLLHRALAYSGRQVLTAYQTYSPCPPRVWLELHKLYAYAESRRLHKTAISDYQHLFTDKTTLQAEYARLLLLALASPYQLRQGEILKIYDSLERWSPQVELRAPGKPAEWNSKTLFCVRLDRDQPPRPGASTALKASASQQFRSLDTEPLTRLLRQDIQNHQEVVSTTLTTIDLSRPDLSHDLLRRLLIAWGGETRRHFPRSHKDEHIEVAIGLSATHHFIRKMGQSTARDVFLQPANYQSHEVSSINEPQPDAWDLVSQTDTSHVQAPSFSALVMQELQHPSRQNLPELNPATVENGYQPGSWAILNESASGYCLEYGEQQATRAQVGELVGIRRSRDGRTWKWGIGVIRWLKFSSGESEQRGGQTSGPADKALQMGIEMLNPAAAAIGIRPAATRHEAENYQRALMLPEIISLHQPATLITSPVPWRAGQHAIISMLGKQIPITLTQVQQHTGLFAQFQFQIEQTGRAEPEQATGDNASWDLNQVWSSI